MSESISKLISTLRGHDVGVTALAHYKSHDGKVILVSGDEKGAIIFWDLTIYRKITGYTNLSQSRIQSLKIVSLKHDNSCQVRQTLIVQTRDDGVKIISLQNLTQKPDNLTTLQCYPTFSSLFSRGDAVTCSDNSSALLAYPSYLDNFLVTVRLVGYEGETHISGTAQRFSADEKTCAVFDIGLGNIYNDLYYVIVAYEDGHISLFNLSPLSTKTIPELATEGLKIDLMKTIDLGINDFVSAFHTTCNDNQLVGVSGSPLAELVFFSQNLKDTTQTELLKVTSKRPGVASIKISPDNKLVAVGSWDAPVNIYSMKSRQILASLRYQTKQVNDIEFVKNPSHLLGDPTQTSDENPSDYLLCCASMCGTVSVVSIY